MVCHMDEQTPSSVLVIQPTSKTLSSSDSDFNEIPLQTRCSFKKKRRSNRIFDEQQKESNDSVTTSSSFTSACRSANSSQSVSENHSHNIKYFGSVNPSNVFYITRNSIFNRKDVSCDKVDTVFTEVATTNATTTTTTSTTTNTTTISTSTNKNNFELENLSYTHINR